MLIAPAPAKAGAQVELDLTKATVNGLLPGWTKPSGRNAKLSFRMLSGADDSTLLRELVLDGGPTVALRGDVDLSHDGTITQALLPAVKLSANDEMRVEMERAWPLPDASGRSVYRAAVPNTRPARDYTARAIPRRCGVAVPLESARILWQR